MSSNSRWFTRKTVILDPVFPKEQNKSSNNKSKGFVAKILGSVWRSIRRIAMTLGFIMIFSAVFMATGFEKIIMGGDSGISTSDELILYWKIDQPIEDSIQIPSFYNGFETKTTLRQYIDALYKAKNDPKVTSLVVSYGGVNINVAHAEELREAIDAFKESGKKAYFFAPEMYSGMGDYYFASAFDSVWLQPVGGVAFAGINIEMPYIKGLLANLGIETDFHKRKEYKNVFSFAQNESMSKAEREMMTALIKGLGGNIRQGVSKSRNISEDKVMELINQGLFTDEQALEYGLVDRIGYEDELINKLKINAADFYNDTISHDINNIDLYADNNGDLQVNTILDNEEENNDTVDNSVDLPVESNGKNPVINTIDIEKYLVLENHNEKISISQWFSDAYDKAKEKLLDKNDVTDKPKSSKIALVYVTGEIVHTADDDSLLSNGRDSASARKLSQILKKIEENPDISATIIRIDSPGGSPAASETIRRALFNLSESGKPVYVSMGAVAASGGYWIASTADKIYSLPSSLTGSIGVAGGKPVFKDLWKKIDVNWEGIKWGENADIWSVNERFDDKALERINDRMDRTYEAFLDVVSEGRNLDRDVVSEIAKGRVWIGSDALDIGLVDELGGLGKAMDDVAISLGFENRDDLEISVYPRSENPLDSLFGAFAVRQGLTGISSIIEFFVSVRNMIGYDNHSHQEIVRTESDILQYVR